MRKIDLCLLLNTLRNRMFVFGVIIPSVNTAINYTSTNFEMWLTLFVQYTRKNSGPLQCGIKSSVELVSLYVRYL
jgi:hypothetical protein